MGTNACRSRQSSTASDTPACHHGRQRKVFIQAVSGYIGGNLAKRFAKEGFEVLGDGPRLAPLFVRVEVV